MFEFLRTSTTTRCFSEDQDPNHPKGQFIKAGSDVIFKRILEEE